MRADIVIVGTGSLAGGVALALSQKSKGKTRIAIIGRSAEKAARLAQIANARAAMFRSVAVFESMEMAEFKASAFSQAFRKLEPKVIFQTASLQSPWEKAGGENGWTQLVAAAGYGVTLPLQMALAAEVSAAAGDSQAAIVNASYPDCVNVALRKASLRVTCGIGNATIVEAMCRAKQGLRNADVRVIGHHGQLAGWLKSKREVSQPRVWVGPNEVDALQLSPGLAAIGEELNQVTAATAIVVILALLSGETLNLSVPGVAELAGGYPYTLKKGKFALRLPPGITKEEAVAHNKIGERSDGLDLDTGARFVGNAERALAQAGFEYAKGFAYEDWDTVRDRILELRERLRRQPAVQSASSQK